MANIIRIKLLNDQSGNMSESNQDSNVLEHPIMDDVQPKYKSTFTSISDEIPIVNKIATLSQLFAAGGGTASKGIENLRAKFNVPIWQGTDAAEIPVKLIFFIEEDAKKDVWDKMRKIISLTILSVEKVGGKEVYRTPGISLATMKAVQDTSTKEISTKGKLISMEIPGIIFLNPAFIESAEPTYSKQITKKGWPIWGTLDLVIKGLYPATTAIFDAVENPKGAKGGLGGEKSAGTAGKSASGG
jgi:hypothetical protein